MKNLVGRFLADESGVAAVEYGLIAALICVPIVASLRGVSEAINATFATLANAMR